MTAKNNVTLIGADTLADLYAATTQYLGSGLCAASPTNTIACTFFRGRDIVVPEVLFRVNGDPAYVPLGTTVRNLIEREIDLEVPLIPGKGSGASTILDNDVPVIFALTMTLDLGSIGGLSSPLKRFAADIVAGWNPSPPSGRANPEAAMTVGIGFKLPESTGGKMQIGIEGVLLLTINNFLLTKLTGDADDASSYYLIYLLGWYVAYQEDAQPLALLPPAEG